MRKDIDKILRILIKHGKCHLIVGSAPAPDSSAAAPAPDQVPVPTNLAVAASAQNSGEPPVRENSHVEGNKNKGAGTGTSTGSVGSSGKIQGNRGTSRPLPPIPMGSNSATTSAGNNPTATVGGESSPNPKVVPQGAPMPVDDIFGSDDEPSAFRFSGKPQDLTLGKPPVAASAQNSGEPSVRKNSPGKGKRNKGSGTGASTGSVGSDSGSDGENQVNESALPPLPPVPPPPPSVSQTGQNKGNGSPAKKTPVKQPGENKGRRSPSPESPVVKARQNHVTAASVLNAIGLQNKNVQPTTKSDAKQGAGLDAQQGTDNEDIIQRLMNRVKQSEQKEEEVKKDDEEEDDEWEEEEPERREQPKEEKTETSKANKSPEVEEDEGPLELLKRKLLDITRITPTKADNKRFKEGDIDKGEVEDFANLVGGAFSQCFQDANGVKAQSVKEILKIDWGKLLSFSAANAQNSITQYCTYHILWRLFIDTLCGPEQQMQAIFYPKAGPIDVERLSKLVANANTIESIQLQKNLPFSQMVDKIKEKTGLEQEKIGAEHRLLLNHASAELRLYNKAKLFRCLSDARLNAIQQKSDTIRLWVEKLESTKCEPGQTFGDSIRREQSEENYTAVPLPTNFLQLSSEVREEVLYKIRYRGYLERENKQIEKTKWLDAIKIPADFDYKTVHGFRNESLQKLEAVRPLTLGQASRISGVNPSDIQILMVALKKQK